MSAPNPFETPGADLQPGPGEAVANAPFVLPWFAVGTRKLMALSILTFGLYTIYWFERQLRFRKARLSEETWPLARALFGIFFARDLFGSVREQAEESGVTVAWSEGALATLYVVFVVVGRIVDRVSMRTEDTVAVLVLSLISWGTMVGFTLPLLRVQGTINAALARTHPGFDRNARFTGLNIFVAVIGGLMWLAALAGTFAV